LYDELWDALSNLEAECAINKQAYYDAKTAYKNKPKYYGQQYHQQYAPAQPAPAYGGYGQSGQSQP